MFLYSFQIYKWSKILLDGLTIIVQILFWMRKADKLRFFQLAWKDYCHLFEEKGLGLQDIGLLMRPC